MHHYSIYTKHITFDELVSYWKMTNHFNDPNKKYTEVLGYLGNLTTPFKDPRRFSYGLFLDDKIIGATHLVHWDDKIVRYRTINILKEYQGNDLGWALLSQAWSKDWKGYGNLLGWVRHDHEKWCLAHGFNAIGTLYDNHIPMTRKMW